MSREEAIRRLLESTDDLNNVDLKQEVKEIKEMLSLIVSVIVVQQKDACEAVGVHPDTVRNKVLRGETGILQRDGSRLNYLTLADAGDLKPRRACK